MTIKNIVLLTLFFPWSFNLYAAKYSSCVGSNCQTEDQNSIDISGLDKREVLKALVGYLQKIKPMPSFLSKELQEAEIDFIRDYQDWNVEQVKGYNININLAPNIINVWTFNWEHGKNAAQKAIAPLKQKVLLS